MKALRRSFLWSNFKEHAILAKAFSFWLSFLQRDLTWCSNVNLLSIWIPWSFSHLLLEMAIPYMLIWISCAEFVRKWDFSGFGFRRLSVNHLNKVSDIFSRSCNTLFKFMLVEWGVLLSASLVISRSGKNWKKSHKNMLNSNGPSMDPCGTPKIISDHKLHVSFNFTLCFHLVKCECNSFKEEISTP